ncbi:UNVERIFIED_CONTAM: hypothetical protein GTU68_010782 [Idotea baltica]|nr:hypothetical protein [Idotea baltica]
MHRSGISERLFGALTPWFARVPGQLIHTNIASSAVFAATSGSSLATAATIGTVAVPNMDKGGYNRPLFLGSIAAGGTLGILIPPSINMIVYSVLSQTSVVDLYAAGFIPGLMLAMLFSGIVLVAVLLVPSLVKGQPADGSLWRARLAGLPHLLPPLMLFCVVVGSIYLGVATPTEASALGLMATLGLVAINGQLSLCCACTERIRGHCAHDLHDHADCVVSIFPESRHGLHWSGGYNYLLYPGSGMVAIGHAAGHYCILSGAGLFHGDNLDDDCHHAHCRSGCCWSGL